METGVKRTKGITLKQSKQQTRAAFANGPSKELEKTKPVKKSSLFSFSSKEHLNSSNKTKTLTQSKVKNDVVVGANFSLSSTSTKTKTTTSLQTHQELLAKMTQEKTMAAQAKIAKIDKDLSLYEQRVVSNAYSRIQIQPHSNFNVNPSSSRWNENAHQNKNGTTAGVVHIEEIK